MYSLKVISISKSGKSVFASVSKVSGIFNSVVATGNLRLNEGADAPAVGDIIKLDGITKVSTMKSMNEDNTTEFTWLVLD